MNNIDRKAASQETGRQARCTVVEANIAHEPANSTSGEVQSTNKFQPYD